MHSGLAELRRRVHWLTVVKECLILLLSSALLLLVLETTRGNQMTLQDAIKTKMNCIEPLEYDELFGLLKGIHTC